MRYTNQDSEFLTVAEVSKILRLNALTIYKYINSGTLKAFEFGGHFRISTDALNAFIKAHQYQKKGTSND